MKLIRPIKLLLVVVPVMGMVGGVPMRSMITFI